MRGNDRTQQADLTKKLSGSEIRIIREVRRAKKFNLIDDDDIGRSNQGPGGTDRPSWY
jgi:hypothetical protein